MSDILLLAILGLLIVNLFTDALVQLSTYMRLRRIEQMEKNELEELQGINTKLGTVVLGITELRASLDAAMAKLNDDADPAEVKAAFDKAEGDLAGIESALEMRPPSGDSPVAETTT